MVTDPKPENEGESDLNPPSTLEGNDNKDSNGIKVPESCSKPADQTDLKNVDTSDNKEQQDNDEYGGSDSKNESNSSPSRHNDKGVDNIPLVLDSDDDQNEKNDKEVNEKVTVNKTNSPSADKSPEPISPKIKADSTSPASKNILIHNNYGQPVVVDVAKLTCDNEEILDIIHTKRPETDEEKNASNLIEKNPSSNNPTFFRFQGDENSSSSDEKNNDFNEYDTNSEICEEESSIADEDDEDKTQDEDSDVAVIIDSSEEDELSCVNIGRPNKDSPDTFVLYRNDSFDDNDEDEDDEYSDGEMMSSLINKNNQPINVMKDVDDIDDVEDDDDDDDNIMDREDDDDEDDGHDIGDDDDDEEDIDDEDDDDEAEDDDGDDIDIPDEDDADEFEDALEIEDDSIVERDSNLATRKRPRSESTSSQEEDQQKKIKSSDQTGFNKSPDSNINLSSIKDSAESFITITLNANENEPSTSTPTLPYKSQSTSIPATSTESYKSQPPSTPPTLTESFKSQSPSTDPTSTESIKSQAPSTPSTSESTTTASSTSIGSSSSLLQSKSTSTGSDTHLTSTTPNLTESKNGLQSSKSSTSTDTKSITLASSASTSPEFKSINLSASSTSTESKISVKPSTTSISTESTNSTSASTSTISTGSCSSLLTVTSPISTGLYGGQLITSSPKFTRTSISNSPATSPMIRAPPTTPTSTVTITSVSETSSQESFFATPKSLLSSKKYGEEEANYQTSPTSSKKNNNRIDQFFECANIVLENDNEKKAAPIEIYPIDDPSETNEEINKLNDSDDINESATSSDDLNKTLQPSVDIDVNNSDDNGKDVHVNDRKIVPNINFQESDSNKEQISDDRNSLNQINRTQSKSANVTTKRRRCSNENNLAKENTKNEDDEGVPPRKKLCCDVQTSFENHNRILSDYINNTSNDDIDGVQSHLNQLGVEIQTLDALIKETETEWNHMLHLKKVKEEIYLRLARRKQALEITTTKVGEVYNPNSFEKGNVTPEHDFQKKARKLLHSLKDTSTPINSPCMEPTISGDDENESLQCQTNANASGQSANSTVSSILQYRANMKSSDLAKEKPTTERLQRFLVSRNILTKRSSDKQQEDESISTSANDNTTTQSVTINKDENALNASTATAAANAATNVASRNLTNSILSGHKKNSQPILNNYLQQQAAANVQQQLGEMRNGHHESVRTNQNGGYQPVMVGRQGAFKDVKSIIAEFRQSHPETVPRRGRRIKPNSYVNDSNMIKTDTNSRPSSNDSSSHSLTNVSSGCDLVNVSFKDVLVQFANNMENQNLATGTRGAGNLQPYPEVTLHPVSTSQLSHGGDQSSGSLLHGILTKNLQHRIPEASNRKSNLSSPNPANYSNFSPTLARLLTAPERITASCNRSKSPNETTSLRNANPANKMNLAKVVGNNSEITITPVMNAMQAQFQNQQSLLQQQLQQKQLKVLQRVAASVASDHSKAENYLNMDYDADNSVDRLIIDESIDDNHRMVANSIGQEFNENDVPVCQGCKKNEAQFVCAGCARQWYCSRDCQVNSWDLHSDVCTAGIELYYYYLMKSRGINIFNPHMKIEEQNDTQDEDFQKIMKLIRGD